MSIRPEKVVTHYIEAYQKLYKRSPRQVKLIDKDWVIVNGARMRISELEYLTVQLQKEYQQSVADKRNVVMRLVRWFKG